MNKSEPALPQSNALAEAEADSLSELLSRDPEDPRVDRKRIVTELRRQRERFILAEQAPKVKKAKAAVSLKTPISASAVDVGDLGL